MSSSSRIIIKNLPKKISEEKFRSHFSTIGQVTEAKLKFTTDGKFRQFGFVGYKTEDEALKAIKYFNNTFIDASKLFVESCKPLNDPDRGRPWSKYSKENLKTNASTSLKSSNKKDETKKEKLNKKEKKAQKLDKLLGPLKDDAQFKEFLAANQAIKGNENIWKNDIHLNVVDDLASTPPPPPPPTSIARAEKSTTSEITSLNEKKPKNQDDDVDFENGRLFVRNLCYTCSEQDLEKLFSPYAPIVETNMPIDSFSKTPKGFAYVTFMFPEKALKAFNELDGTIFQGRMLHIIPARSKKDDHDELGQNEAKFKSKKDSELKKKAQSGHNWNSLFINQDAVANLMASRYNIDKSEIFDVHGTGKKKSNAAVKLAVGETQIVNDMRLFLIRNGVKLDSFQQQSNNTERSKTVVLIKNLPNNTSENELRDMFTNAKVNEECVKRLVMPEYGMAALVEFAERQEARDAFKKLAYRKFKSVPVYLEWAPVDVFDGNENEKNEQSKEINKTTSNVNTKKDKEEDDYDGDDGEEEPDSTLFVKNLNFDTNEASLKKLFSKIGKCKATIARKVSPNKESLSMGYGFVKFKKASHALEALKTHQNISLDGHNLELKFSNRTSQTSSNIGNNRRQKSINTTPKEKSSKILVRNIPFEAKAKELEELFRVFGELKYCRLPKKVDGAHRGFGFVDFVTINDAQRAFEALSHSTHLFGRRLVLEWAEPEQAQDVELLRMKEEKISGPRHKKLKKSKILEDLGGDHEGDGGETQSYNE